MGRPSYEMPGSEAMTSLMAELEQALTNLPDTQERLTSLSATAWSEDGMVKAEVGPRGQLVDLEIDPRVFRRPDAHVLKASIMEAVTAAIRHVSEQANQLVLSQMPPELSALQAQFPTEGDDPVAQALQTDAELLAERRRADDQLR